MDNLKGPTKDLHKTVECFYNDLHHGLFEGIVVTDKISPILNYLKWILVFGKIVSSKFLNSKSKEK